MEPTSDVEVSAEEPSLWHTVKGDLADAGGRRLLGVVAVLGWLAFQWGWGNDVLLPPIVTRAFELVDDGKTWPSAAGSIAAGTAAGSIFWALTQTLDGIIVLSGSRLVPRITARFSRLLARQGLIKPLTELSTGTRFLIAFASGASMLCLIDVFATGEPGVRGRVTMLRDAVTLAVGGVALAVFVVTTTTAIGRRVPATSEVAEVVLRYARNPVTWLVFYGSLVVGAAVVERIGRWVSR